MQEVLEISHVTKKFAEHKASDDISFSVKQGGIFGLLGPNGAGKTTLIRMITNIYVPDSGHIRMFGETVSAAHQNRIGYLPEERGLYRKQKVLNQLVYFGTLKGLGRKEAEQKARMWLIRVGAADWADKKIQDLSKGMQQKVQFVATVLHEPELVILDEPFSGFDPINAEMLKNILLEMKEQGRTVILSTHVMHQVEQMCDEIALINKGRVVLNGNVREIKRSFGRNTVNLEFEGSDAFIDKIADAEVISRTKNRAELRVLGKEFNAMAVLATITAETRLHKFELAEPSFHDIFVNVVKGGNSDEK